MKTKPFIKIMFCLILTGLLLSSLVVAEDVTCSFINITTGPAGSNGTNGTNGTAATVAVNYTFTGATGTSAIVTNVGTTAAALFDFTIPTGATGAKGDTGAIPDVTQFLFLNGTRAMTGNLSMGTYFINGLGTPSIGTDAATKAYVDSVSSNYNASYWTGTNYNATYDAKPSSNYNATYDAKADTNYNASYWTGTNYNASYITSNYNSSYWTGTNYNASYWTGTNYNATYDTQSNYNASYVTLTNTSYVQTNNGSYVQITNTSYFLTDGTRAMAANISMGSMYITGLLSGSSGGSVVNKSYVDALPIYNSSYVTLTNTTYVKNNVSGYVTLMAGSAMVTTTNPATMSQTENGTNNFISLDFADGGSEVGQWIMDFPADWNPYGNVVFTPIWTAATGSGTCNWTIKAKLFPDDAALNTALAQVGTSNDTLTAQGDLDVGPDTAGAAIGSVASGGNTAIIQINRDTTDTGTFTAQLIGLRVKYVRTLA